MYARVSVYAETLSLYVQIYTLHDIIKWYHTHRI